MDAASHDDAPTRVRLDLGYDGGGFHGWARQRDLRTVQGALEQALARLFASVAEPPTLTVAGRTDVGVHATGQVAHLDLRAPQLRLLARGGRQAGSAGVESLPRRLAGVLQPQDDVRVHRASLAPGGFDARFSALWRRYEYRIADAESAKDPRTRGFTTWHPTPLRLDAMRSAAASLLGLHDFAAYCKPREGATTIRTLQEFDWRRDADGVLVATVRADAFCHSMVRALVGACLAAGEERIAAGEAARLRDAGVRTSAIPVLPARGLTLVEVGYPPDDELAARAERTRARRERPTPAGPADPAPPPRFDRPGGDRLI
ncbi:MAG: tRNA pseudouridine(38-40) synthase TruA [Actinomycetales bacterium]|nr:tRNA pseudouridine(38-40) synthase TruA [Actinomycetales bacterium]